VSPSARGYILTELAHRVASQSLTRILVNQSVDVGVGLLNPAAVIAITVNFPLNTFYTVVLLTEKQSVAVLLSSIVGLAGIIGGFRALLSAHEYCEKQMRGGRGRAKGDAGETPNVINPLAALGWDAGEKIVLGAPAARLDFDGGGGEDDIALQTNPMHGREGGSPAGEQETSAPGEAAAASVPASVPAAAARVPAAAAPNSSAPTTSSGLLPRDGSRLSMDAIHAASVGHLRDHPVAAAMAAWERGSMSQSAWGALAASVTGEGAATRVAANRGRG
jgi:hypothetical protein